MSAKSSRDRDARVLMTFLMFVFVAVPVTSSLLESPVKSQGATVVKSTSEISRLPASERSMTLNANEVSSVSTFQFDCNTPSLTLDGNQVRWVGKWCAGKEWEKLEVVNQTNGFTASVMALRDLNFTTDFVDLAEGENEFSFKATLADGEVVQKTVKVFRRSPASQTEQAL